MTDSDFSSAGGAQPAARRNPESATGLRNREMRLQRIRALASGASSSSSSMNSSADGSSSSPPEHTTSSSSNSGSFPSRTLPEVAPLKAPGSRASNVFPAAGDSAAASAKNATKTSFAPSSDAAFDDSIRPPLGRSSRKKRGAAATPHSSAANAAEYELDPMTSANASEIMAKLSMLQGEGFASAMSGASGKNVKGGSLAGMSRAEVARERLMMAQIESAAAAESAARWARVHVACAIAFAIFMFYRLVASASFLYGVGRNYMTRLLDPDPSVYADMMLPPGDPVFTYFLLMESSLVALRLLLKRRRQQLNGGTGDGSNFSAMLTSGDPMMNALVSRLGPAGPMLISTMEVLVDVVSQAVADMLHVIFIFGCCLMTCWAMTKFLSKHDA